MIALGKNVLVKKIDEETTSESGLILTGTSGDSLFQKATVLSVGNKVEQVSDNDVIFFMKNQGAEIRHQGSTFMVVKEEHIVSRLGE